jgi:hypothetical protein
LIAQFPGERRDESRMMVLHRTTNRIEHCEFGNLVEYLRAGDVPVLNDSKVIPARLRAVNPKTGGAFEILLLEENAPNTRCFQRFARVGEGRGGASRLASKPAEEDKGRGTVRSVPKPSRLQNPKTVSYSPRCEPGRLALRPRVRRPRIDVLRPITSSPLSLSPLSELPLQPPVLQKCRPSGS